MKRKDEEVRKFVRNGYAKVARQKRSCCPSTSCCGNINLAKSISRSIGYSDDEINAVPSDANLGLGCGNPVAIAELKEGDVVLDLGSGAGFDVFLAARRVGCTGRVIGLDMTPEMIKKARANALKGHFTNVEFRLGEIEEIPAESNSVDVVISNCVINLSPDKRSVFKEAFRVLKPGGRMMISDLVLEKELPKAVRDSVEAYVGCLSGAIRKRTYLDHIRQAGFQGLRIVSQVNFPVEAMANDTAARAIKNNPGIRQEDIKKIGSSVASIRVTAVKPSGKRVEAN